MLRTLPLLLTALFALPGSTAVAAAPDAGAPMPGLAPAAPDSPRVSLQRFLDLGHTGRAAEAAAYLDLPPEKAADGPRLANELVAVLEAHEGIDLTQVSPLSGGDPDDGLQPLVDEVTRVPAAGGRLEPVRLQRRAGRQAERWAFTPYTVSRIDTWYAQLDDHWLRAHLPHALLTPGPRGLLWWHWLALPFLFGMALVVGSLLSAATRFVLGHLARRTAVTWDDELVRHLRGPLALAWALILTGNALPYLHARTAGVQFLDQGLDAGIYAAFFWFLIRVADAGGQMLLHSRWGGTHLASKPLIGLGVRGLKATIGAIAVVAVVAQLGYPVASLIAGLGVGGLAVALASQKTVENLFGAFTIAVDQPFREGDYVRIDDLQGTVEVIGLRSTRIRTLDRTLVTLPNGKLAELRIETFSVRDRMRLSFTLGLVYATTGDQLRAVLAGIDEVLRGEPKLWPNSRVVRFTGFGESALQLEVSAWFMTTDSSEFLLIREGVLLKIMDVVTRAGSAIAVPARSVQLTGDAR